MKEKKLSLKDRIKKYKDFSMSGKNSFAISVTSASSSAKTVLIDGVEKIKKYTEESVVLGTKREELVFCGENLKCLAYASGAIEICGSIMSISFNAENVK